jgi:spore coat polysaccharide biosynthesis protein SpsF
VKVVVVIQARVASTRLPGKVLLPVLDEPLIVWNVGCARAIEGVTDVMAAVTTDAGDDPLVDILEAQGVSVHRGPDRDVLARFWGAVEPVQPDYVIRLTSDTPLLDPGVISGQLARCMQGDIDYIGIAGWPVGIAGEVVPLASLETAYHEAEADFEREHVMPFLYSRTDRFRIGTLPPREPLPPGRFAVDTADDLAFVRAIAERLGSVRTTSYGELREILEREPELLDLNRDVRQKHWSEAQTPGSTAGSHGDPSRAH